MCREMHGILCDGCLLEEGGSWLIGEVGVPESTWLTARPRACGTRLCVCRETHGIVCDGGVLGDGWWWLIGDVGALESTWLYG